MTTTDPQKCHDELVASLTDKPAMFLDASGKCVSACLVDGAPRWRLYGLAWLPLEEFPITLAERLVPESRTLPVCDREHVEPLVTLTEEQVRALPAGTWVEVEWLGITTRGPLEEVDIAGAIILITSYAGSVAGSTVRVRPQDVPVIDPDADLIEEIKQAYATGMSAGLVARSVIAAVREHDKAGQA